MSLPELLKSKRFWTLLVALVVYVANSTVDGLNLNVDAVTAVVIAVIAGYSIEDWIEAWNAGKLFPGAEATATAEMFIGIGETGPDAEAKG